MLLKEAVDQALDMMLEHLRTGDFMVAEPSSAIMEEHEESDSADSADNTLTLMDVSVIYSVR